MQSEFSLLYREEATETREAVKDLGISFVAYAPLGRSLLAGVVPDFANLAAGDTRARHPRFEGENFEKNRALVERVEAIAADKACTWRSCRWPGCWRRARTCCRSPAPSASSGWRKIWRRSTCELTQDDIDSIAGAVPLGAAAGTRYPAGGMKGVYI